MHEILFRGQRKTQIVPGKSVQGGVREKQKTEKPAPCDDEVYS